MYTTGGDINRRNLETVTGKTTTNPNNRKLKHSNTKKSEKHHELKMLDQMTKNYKIAGLSLSDTQSLLSLFIEIKQITVQTEI